MIEISFSGVPSIAIPLFADQFRNVGLLEDKQVGIGLNLHELTAETLTKALNEIIYNEKYRKNAVKLSKIINNKPLSPRDRIMRYIKHSIDFIDFDGSDNIDCLDLYGRHLNYIQFYNLDVYLFLFLSLIVGMYSIYRVLLILLKLLKNKKKID